MMAVAGVMVGMLIGALPGVGPPSGVAMLLPLTFGMDPTSGLASRSHSRRSTS